MPMYEVPVLLMQQIKGKAYVKAKDIIEAGKMVSQQDEVNLHDVGLNNNHLIMCIYNQIREITSIE